jgi:hypothetical protein
MYDLCTFEDTDYLLTVYTEIQILKKNIAIPGFLSRLLSVKLTICLADLCPVVCKVCYLRQYFVYLYIFSSILQLEGHKILTLFTFPPLPTPPPPTAQLVQIQSKNSFTAQKTKEA